MFSLTHFTANATSFGTLSTARRLAQGVNDATIGLVAGANPTNQA